jgi:putative ABC transport system permease protein
MKFEDFRIGWRLLLRQPAYSSIAVLGLALAFAACFLILALVRYSFSFDSSIAGVDRVYVVQSRAGYDDAGWTANIPMPSAASIEQSGMPVTVTRVMQADALEMQVNNATQAIPVLTVDPAFGAVFGIRVVRGDLVTSLARPDGLVLTQQTATRLFGDTEAVGKAVLIAGKKFQVGAVIADPADNVTLQYAALVGINSAALSAPQRLTMTDGWNDLAGQIYVRLGDGANVEGLAQRLRADLDKSPLRSRLSAEEAASVGNNPLIEVRLRPLRESFFNGLKGRGGLPSKRGNATFIAMFIVAAAAVLLLATVNFVNLTTVRTISRRREIAMRKILGAGRMGIIGQMVAESVLVVLIAAFVGMLLAWLVLPGFSNLLQMRLENLLTFGNVGLCALLGVVLALVVGAVAGVYPAWIALKVRPVSALSGRNNSEGVQGAWLRRLLTVVQFATGLSFASIALCMSFQMSFLSSMDLGFDPDPMLSLIMPEDMTEAKAQSFVETVRHLPGVANVVTSEESIGEGVIYQYEVKNGSGKSILIRGTRVGPGYFDMFGVKPIAGRMFDPKVDQLENSHAMVIDRNAVTELGFASPEAAIGQFVTTKGTTYQIVGVNADMITQPITSRQYATIYIVSPKTHTVTVKITGDRAAVQAGIQQAWRQHFADHVFEINSVRTLLDRSVKQQMAPYITVVNTATFIAGALAAFGMYILSATNVQRKTREIVLRKLHGARPTDIARLLAKEYSILLGIAALIGVPLGMAGGLTILSEFALQTPLGPWAAVPALIAALVLALLASLQHTLAAMRLAPAVALRS